MKTQVGTIVVSKKQKTLGIITQKYQPLGAATQKLSGKNKEWWVDYLLKYSPDSETPEDTMGSELEEERNFIPLLNAELTGLDVKLFLSGDPNYRYKRSEEIIRGNLFGIVAKIVTMLPLKR